MLMAQQLEEVIFLDYHIKQSSELLLVADVALMLRVVLACSIGLVTDLILVELVRPDRIKMEAAVELVHKAMVGLAVQEVLVDMEPQALLGQLIQELVEVAEDLGLALVAPVETVVLDISTSFTK
jgi:hypothetical protein